MYPNIIDNIFKNNEENIDDIYKIFDGDFFFIRIKVIKELSLILDIVVNTKENIMV